MKKILSHRILAIVFLLAITHLANAQRSTHFKKPFFYHKIKKTDPLDSITKALKGNLLLPFDGYDVAMPYGLCKLDSKACLQNPGITFRADENKNVRVAWDGVVSDISVIDNMYVVIIRCGRLFFGYSNLAKPTVSINQHLSKGESIGQLERDDNGNYSMDFLLSAKDELNPTAWFNWNKGSKSGNAYTAMAK